MSAATQKPTANAATSKSTQVASAKMMYIRTHLAGPDDELCGHRARSIQPDRPTVQIELRKQLRGAPHGGDEELA